MTNIRVDAFTLGKDVPSSRYRVRQYRKVLISHGVELVEHCPRIRQQVRLPGLLKNIRRRYLFPWLIVQTLINVSLRIPALLKSRSAQIILINRQVIPGLNEAVHLIPRPRILDVDDAIWLSDPRGIKAAKHLASNVDAVITGNDYLANWYIEFNKNVYVVPTGVDTDKFYPVKNTKNEKYSIITIGWVGTSGNFPHLELVREALEEIARDRDDIRILIISDCQPDNWRFEYNKFFFKKWSPESELKYFQKIDIGLMPLQDSEWAKGKCSFKMLQYLSVGIPVVVSPVGMNIEVLNKGEVGFSAKNKKEWYNSLRILIENSKLRKDMGENGRLLVEKEYSLERVGGKLANLFQEISKYY